MAPDDKAFAIVTGPGSLTIRSAVDGRELAAIETSDQTREALNLQLAIASPLIGGAIGFSADGARLLVAAVAALWILPAAAFAVVGSGVYKALEWLARGSGLT